MSIQMTEDKFVIHVEDEIKTIYFNQIQAIDRSLPGSISNSIIASSRCGSFLLIDYTQASKLLSGEALYSLILTGKKSEMSHIKSLLVHVTGINADPLISKMTSEEKRLLILLANNINRTDILMPIFDNDSKLLQECFTSLNAKDLVDKYASITQRGYEILEKIKGIEHKKIGMETTDNINDIGNHWRGSERISVIPGVNTFVWRGGKSTLSGMVLTEDIYKYLPLGKVKSKKLSMQGTSIMRIIMQTTDETSVFIASSDYSIILALYGLFSKDIKYQILLCFYFGFKSKKDTYALLNLAEDVYNYYYQCFLNDKLIDPQDMELTYLGLDQVYNKLLDEAFTLLNLKSSQITFENFKRYEQIKSINAKKKIIDALNKRNSENRYFKENSSSDTR
jgi:hypothetical protein